jgi:hypothetical protein
LKDKANPDLSTGNSQAKQYQISEYATKRIYICKLLKQEFKNDLSTGLGGLTRIKSVIPSRAKSKAATLPRSGGPLTANLHPQESVLYRIVQLKVHF